MNLDIKNNGAIIRIMRAYMAGYYLKIIAGALARDYARIIGALNSAHNRYNDYLIISEIIGDNKKRHY